MFASEFTNNSSNCRFSVNDLNNVAICWANTPWNCTYRRLNQLESASAVLGYMA